MVKTLGGWNPSIFYAPDGQGAGGEGQAGGTGDGQQNPNGGGQPGAQPPAAGAGNQPGGQQGDPNAGGAKKVYTYQEDRTDWVPRHRLNEQGTKFEKEIAAIRKEMQSHGELGNRLRAALDPNGGQDPTKQKEIEETRAALLQIFPELGKLGDIQNAVAGSQRQVQQNWERHAHEMMNGLHTEAAKAIGVDALSETQKQKIARLYRTEAQDCAAARTRAMQTEDRNYDFDNDFISRHERGDRTLLAEFVKGLVSDFYEPGKRAGAADASRRNSRPVPRGDRTRQLPAGGTPQIDFNNETAFKEALIKARNGGG